LISNAGSAHAKDNVLARGKIEKISTGRVSDATHLNAARNGDTGNIGSGKRSYIIWPIGHSLRRPISGGVPITAAGAKIPGCASGVDCRECRKYESDAKQDAKK
jgi:hypothetical protein